MTDVGKLQLHWGDNGKNCWIKRSSKSGANTYTVYKNTTWLPNCIVKFFGFGKKLCTLDIAKTEIQQLVKRFESGVGDRTVLKYTKTYLQVIEKAENLAVLEANDIKTLVHDVVNDIFEHVDKAIQQKLPVELQGHFIELYKKEYEKIKKNMEEDGKAEALSSIKELQGKATGAVRNEEETPTSVIPEMMGTVNEILQIDTYCNGQTEQKKRELKRLFKDRAEMVTNIYLLSLKKIQPDEITKSIEHVLTSLQATQ